MSRHPLARLRNQANPRVPSEVQPAVGLPRTLSVILATALLAGCPASSEEVQPQRDQIDFPSGLALSPAQDLLFAVSANSNLRYSSGLVSVFDADLIDSLIDGWLDSGDPGPCQPDGTSPAVLACDESDAVLSDASVRIGNFATAIAVQTLDSGDLRLFVPVRGDPSVTWIDVDPSSGELSCGGSGSLPECDEAHRLTDLRGDASLGTVVDEPFGVFVDSQNHYALVSHLTRGAVSLIDTPGTGDPPVLTDAAGGLFASNGGSAGATGIAGRVPGSAADLIYVTSRSEARVQVLYVKRPDGGGLPFLVPADFFFLNMVQPSTDARGIAFSSDGSRAFIVNRQPPMLHVVDTSAGPTGVPRNVLVGAIELCDQPSNIALADTGSGPVAYVACFDAGQVWAIDPGTRAVKALIAVGRGPHALAVSPDRNRLYVGNFLDSTISVVDITPGAITENHVVLRLGRPVAGGKGE